MTTLTIKTNNKPRETIYGYALTDKERAEFDYLTPGEIDDAEFFRYKGQVYFLYDFMPSTHEGMSTWDGYMSDSYFSGIVIRYVKPDRGYIVVGRYFS